MVNAKPQREDDVCATGVTVHVSTLPMPLEPCRPVI
jgi:hypothetical protein